MFWMVRAEIVSIHADARAQKFFGHPLHERMKVSLGIQLPRDSRLIGNDNQFVTACLRIPAQFKNPRGKLHLLRFVQVAYFPVDNSIPVEKQGWLKALHRMYRLPLQSDDRDPAPLIGKIYLFYKQAENMLQGEMRLLDFHGRVRRHAQAIVAQPDHATSICACQADGHNSG